MERGQRIAQMVLCPIVKANLEEVNTLNDTERGSGGLDQQVLDSKYL